ncbi:MAG: class I adenylate-forming enzyme family protein [Chitinivibrionales bacterium]
MLLNSFLSESAKRFGEKAAVITKDRQLSYAQLDDLSNRLANGLLSGQIARQDRVAVYLENSLESAVSIFGILKAGGVFLVINPQVKKKKLQYILNDCQVRVLITDKKGAGELNDPSFQAPHLKTVLVADYGLSANLEHPFTVQQVENKPDLLVKTLCGFIERSSDAVPPENAIDIDLAALIYTSGSTGDPKGVMMTHTNIVTASRSITGYLENVQDDVILNTLPLSFDYGLYQMIMSVQFGGTIVLQRQFLYPFEYVQQIINYKATALPLVPAMAAILLQLKGIREYDFSHVRYITNTGQALPPAHIMQLQEIFPNARIYSMYGLTECKRVSYLHPAELHRRPNSVGKAMPNTEVWLVDGEGRKITEPDTVGELVIRGAHVMKGYWKKPLETDKVLREGVYPQERVLYSGDYFKMDEEGFLYFVSRKDDMIKSGGERISPREIEDVLYEHPEISEVAVIGVPDEILGYAIKAVVVLKDGTQIGESELSAFCSSRLERARVPKYIEFMERLPKSHSGKIKKTALAE